MYDFDRDLTYLLFDKGTNSSLDGYLKVHSTHCHLYVELSLYYGNILSVMGKWHGVSTMGMERAISDALTQPDLLAPYPICKSYNIPQTPEEKSKALEYCIDNKKVPLLIGADTVSEVLGLFFRVVVI